MTSQIAGVLDVMCELRRVLIVVLVTWICFAAAVLAAVWLVIHLDIDNEETDERQLRSRRGP